MNQESNTKMTGKNLSIALLISLIVTLVMTLIYSLMGFLINADVSGSFTTAIDLISRQFFSLFKAVGICVAPIVFLITFALLQRFRTKN